MGLIETFSRLEMLPHHISPSFQELTVVRCRFVGSCQLNSRLIKSKFVSEFVGTDKPTKFVSCRFVGSCQLNSRLIKSLNVLGQPRFESVVAMRIQHERDVPRFSFCLRTYILNSFV